MTVTPEVPRILSVPACSVPFRNSNPSTCSKFPNIAFLRYSAVSLPAPKPGSAAQLLCFQQFVNSLMRFAAATICFQRFVDSFAKNTGGGWYVVKSTCPLPRYLKCSSATVTPLPLSRGNRKYRVLRRRHRNVALTLAPKDGIQDLVVGLVCMAPVHRGGCFCPRGSRRIALEN
jgi:hypothetical protein